MVKRAGKFTFVSVDARPRVKTWGMFQDGLVNQEDVCQELQRKSLCFGALCWFQGVYLLIIYDKRWLENHHLSMVSPCHSIQVKVSRFHQAKVYIKFTQNRLVYIATHYARAFRR